MQDWNLDEVVERISFLTKDNWTHYKYVLKRGNLTLETDRIVIQMIFGRPMPFRVVKNDDKSSVDIERDRLLHFTIQMDLLRSFGYHEYINLMSGLERGEYALPKTDQTHIKGLKALAKSARISEDSLEKQILYQAIYDTTFRFMDKLEQDTFLHNYFNEYIVDNYCDRVSFHMPGIVKTAIHEFAWRISNRLSSSLMQFSMDLPPASGKRSAMGLKVKDQSFMIYFIANEKVWKGVEQNVLLRYDAMKLLHLDTNVLDHIQWTDSFNEESLMMFAPKINGIESTEFKPRIVYQSTDLDDIILDPFMRFLRLVESFCKCSFSTYRPNDERLNSKYTVARMVSEKALDLLHCGESNSDLTMATDKLSGDCQGEMVLEFIDNLMPDCRNLMDDLGLTREYFEQALKIINQSMVWTKYNDNSIETGYPKSGQCQGERGSFHCLHFQNMMYGLAAYLENGLSYDQWEETSIYQGDDADVPDRIQPTYIRLWIDTSLPGIGSTDKTSSEESEGALLFCKNWIKTGKPSPKIINGLKFNQLMRIFNDPQQMNDFVSFDIFQDRLIGRLKGFVRMVHAKYGHLGVLPNYSEVIYDNQTRNRMRHWKEAQNLCSYKFMMTLTYPDFAQDILPEAYKGLCQEMSPYERAKTLTIRNQFLKFDLYVGAISLQRFGTIVAESSTITHPLQDIESFFSEYRDEYVNSGIIPEWDHRIAPYIWEQAQMLLRLSGVPQGSYNRDDIRQQLEAYYKLSFVGYQDSHVVRVELTFKS